MDYLPKCICHVTFMLLHCYSLIAPRCLQSYKINIVAIHACTKAENFAKAYLFSLTVCTCLRCGM